MKLLFVCTGNTCRSPMAEGYIRSLCRPDLTAQSAGLMPGGEAATAGAVEAMFDYGADLSSHRSQPVTPSMLLSADRIYCMSESHRQVLLSYGIDGTSMSVLGGGIPDPFGGDLSTYRGCRDAIIQAINRELDLALPTVSTEASDDALQEIETVERSCFSTPWSLGSLRSARENSTRFFTVTKDGQTIGYAGLSTVASEGYLTNVAVLPTYRNQGVASALMRGLTAYAVQKKLSFLSLEVRPSNESAVRLYKRFGFKEVGRRKAFYDAPIEDALILTRRFN